MVFIDAKATEPTLAAELIAAYTAGAGFVPRVKLWPAEPLSGWQGDPMELANRLLAVQDWSEPWYERVASRAIRLACGADIGPPRSADELLARLTAPGLEQLYAGTDRAELVRQLIDAKGFEGAALRYGDFFDALAGRFDGTWSYDDADLAVLSLPVLAAREDASAAFRLLLEDLGHYGVARKDRDDQGMTVYLEEFSAVSDGARAAIDLAERLRDAGVGVVFVVQSYEGLGDEHQAARLLGSSAALIVHRMPQPERLLAAAGTIWTPEQTWQLDQWGPDGHASVRMAAAAPGRPGRRAPRRGRRSMDHRRRPQPPPPGRRDPVQPAAGRAAHPPPGRPGRRRGAAAVGRRPARPGAGSGDGRGRGAAPAPASAAAPVAGAAAAAPPARHRRPRGRRAGPATGVEAGRPGRAHLGRPGRAGRADRGPAPAPPQPAAGLAGLADPHRPSTEDQAMTDDEIMRQLSQAVRDDDVLAAEEMVTAGQQQHPEWDWPFLATVLWIQRGQVQEPEPPRQPAWRRWLRWLVDGGRG